MILVIEDEAMSQFAHLQLTLSDITDLGIVYCLSFILHNTHERTNRAYS